MGKAVAVVAGAALIYFSGGLATGAVMGAYGAGITSAAMMMGVYTAVGAIATIAGGMLIANAFSPSMPDMSSDSAGQKLQTQKTNIAPVPAVYGENKLGGNILWQKTNNYGGGSTNNDYWAVIAIAQGEIESYLNLFANDDEMTLKSAGIYTTKYVHVKAYTGGTTGTSVYDLDFVIDQAGTTATGSTIFDEQTFTVSSTAAGSAAYLTDGSLTASSYWKPSSSTDEWIKLLSDGVTLSSIDACSIHIQSTKEDSLFQTHVYSFKLQYSDDDSAWSDASDVIENEYRNDEKYWAEITSITTAEHYHWRIFFTTIELTDEYDATSGSYVWEVDLSSSVTSAVSIPKELAFLTVHQEYILADTAHVQLDNLSTIIEGRQVREMTSSAISPSTVSYSNNPARIIIDILVEGLNVSVSDLDVASFWAAHEHCENNDIACNITYNQQVQIDSGLQSALATIRGFISYSNSKWILVYDGTKTSVRTLDNDDILNGSFTISMKSNTEIANKISVKYISPNDGWQTAKVSFEDTDLVTLDGQNIEKIVDIVGVTNLQQAQLFAELMLNQMRYSEDSSGNRINQSPLIISFATSLKNADLEVGDMVTISHDLLNYDRKFAIVSLETDQSGAIKIAGAEYCDTHYDGIYTLYPSLTLYPSTTLYPKG